MSVESFNAVNNVATIQIAAAGWRIQGLDLKLSDDGSAVEVVSVSNSDDPRRTYLEMFSLPVDTEMLVIAKDLSGKRRPKANTNTFFDRSWLYLCLVRDSLIGS